MGDKHTLRWTNERREEGASQHLMCGGQPMGDKHTLNEEEGVGQIEGEQAHNDFTRMSHPQDPSRKSPIFSS